MGLLDKWQKFNERWQRKLDELGKQSAARREEQDKKYAELEEFLKDAFRGSQYGVRKEILPDGKVKISWRFVLPIFAREMFGECRLLGFRKRGGGFSENPLSEEGNGVCIVDTRQDGLRMEEGLVGGDEYFYTFFIKSVMSKDGQGQIDVTDPVRFSVPIPKGEQSAPPHEAKQTMDWENFEESLKDLEREIKKDLHLLAEEDRIIAQVQESDGYKRATAKRRREMIDAIRRKFEEMRMGRFDE